MIETRSIIVELLSQLGSSREAREYLSRFSAVDSSQFAVIKVGGAVLNDELDELAWALTFLHRVGLYPIVLHGAGVQLNSALAEASVATEMVDGMRRTPAEAMAVIRPVMYEQNLKLVDALEERGVKARSVVHGVFECSLLNEDRYGLVGKVEKIHSAPLDSAVRSGALPIVSCLGETPAGQALNVNADVAAAALVRSIRPHKIVFLTPTGGLLNSEGRIISAISLSTDYERLMEAEWVHSGMRLKLEQIKSLLDDLPASSSLSITSADRLTRELFTHTGSGTLVRQGEGFTVREKPRPDDLSDIAELIEQCFEQELLPTVWKALDIDACIVSDTKRAAAIVCIGQDGVAYLDKFAVTPQARGEGLGAALWNQLKLRYPQLYWRARQDNPINPWYQRKAEFSLHRTPWRIFSYGIESFEQIGRLVEDARSRPVAWKARPSKDPSGEDS